MQPFAGQYTVEFTADTLILTEQVADFASAHPDIACRHVDVRANQAVKLGHKALAECHDLAVGFALGIKVRAAFAAANRQAGQAVFKDLFKTQKFQNAQIDARMKPQAALIGPDGIIKLDAVAAVDPDFSAVVDPRHAETDRAVRLSNALQNPCLFICRVLCKHRLQCLEHFGDGLVEFWFAWTFLQDGFECAAYVRHHINLPALFRVTSAIF